MGTTLQTLLQKLLNSPGGPENLSARRRALFAQIHEIVFYGKGGYDFDTVYNLPIWLRNFIYHELVDAYKAEAESAEGKGSKQVERPVANQQVMQKLRKQTNFSVQRSR